MAAVVGSSPIARSRKIKFSSVRMGFYFSWIGMGRESKRKYQLLLVFFLREPARGGERGVPLLAPENPKNSHENGGFWFLGVWDENRAS